MSVKTAGVGHIQLPAAPAAGVSITSGTANNYTTTAVAIGTTPSAVFITGIHVEAAAAKAATYISVQLMVGASAIGQYLVPLTTASTVALGFRPIFPPIPVATATSVTAKVADSVGSAAVLVSLEIIAQANVVDDGIAVTTVTTVTNQLTAAAIATGVWQDATAGDFTTASSIGKSLYIANVAPGGSGGFLISGSNSGTTTFGAITCTGAFSVNGVSNVSQTGDSFAVVKSGGTGDNAAIKTKTDFLPSATAGAAGGVFIAGTNAATTITTALTTTFTGNLTGSVGSVSGAVGSVTAAVTLPSIPADWITAAGITAAALNGKGDWNVGKTGYSISGVKTTLDALNDITAASVWAVATRLLTAGTNIVLAKGTGVTGFNDIAATDIVSAGAITTSAGKVSGVILADTVTTYTGNTVQTGDAFAQIAGVKAKTDQLSFTIAGKADAGIYHINGTTIIGNGSGTPFGV